MISGIAPPVPFSNHTRQMTRADINRMAAFEERAIPYLIDKATEEVFPLPCIVRTGGRLQHMPTRKPELQDLQRAVGGYIEYVPIPAMPGLRMVVDEEGLLKDKKYNAMASEIAMRPIVGDAVIMEIDEDDE